MSAIRCSDDRIRHLAMEASVGMGAEAIQLEEEINLVSKMGAELLQLYLGLQHFQK